MVSIFLVSDRKHIYVITDTLSSTPLFGGGDSGCGEFSSSSSIWITNYSVVLDS